MAKRSQQFGRTAGFSIANMRDDYDAASQGLFEAMASQNPNIDFDDFDMALRKLVMSFGGEKPFMSPAYASLVEAATSEAPQSVYSETADILLLAFDAHRKNERRDARQLFEAAMDCSDAEVLLEALAMNNKNTTLNVQAADDDEDNNEDEDESTDNGEEPPTVDLNDEDDDQSDNLDNSSNEDVSADDAKDPSKTKTSSKSKEDTDEEESSPPPKLSPEKMAAANKLSQNGTARSLVKAQQIK